ncbi:MAG: chromosome segregation protein SMC [Porticoccaceae bacterium]|nr:chromosome segregation protein SMC [Porticoccaceae bacterium]
MRLKCIKLAGFKSFVDPTTVTFPSNLCAVVGPNGCGKSNIIDAVRWVMGESSVKQLRGESMSDVIFNGSGGRKPVGQASIELVFDNSDGTLGGEYASYSEISIRRTVARDGNSGYFLNGSRCRRRDITDVFLGTGLGPRSYSIIEQGMISSLVSSRPEELRGYIEEAAGISKYKERRKDTESRIRRTRENLERLTDIREELARQLQRLERQSKAAEKYTEFKKEERLLRGQLLALRWSDFNDQVEERDQIISAAALKTEALITDKSGCDTQLEKFRIEHTECNEKFREVQGRYYAVGAEVARVEQSIKHAKDRAEELQRDLDQTQRNFAESEQHLIEDKAKAEGWHAELEEIVTQVTKAKNAEAQSSEQLISAEQAMSAWQSSWDEFNEGAVQPQRQVEVQKSRIEHLEASLSTLAQRVKRLSDDQAALEASPEAEQTAGIEGQLADIRDQSQAAETQHSELLGAIETARQNRTQSASSLNQARAALQQSLGRKASVEALQAAALGGDKGREKWLSAHGLTDAENLTAQLKVDSGWETAVETVLGDFLQAVSVDQLSQYSNALDDWTAGKLVLVDSDQASRGQGEVVGASAHTRLSTKIEPCAASPLLNNIYAVDTLNAAMTLRSELSDGESVVSKDGHWLGANWARVTRGENNISGVLVRQRELAELEEGISVQKNDVASLEQKLADTEQQLGDQERQRESSAAGLRALQENAAQLKSRLNIAEAKIEQDRKQRQRISGESEEAALQQTRDRDSLADARKLLESAITAMADDSERRETLLARRDANRGALDQARQAARHDHDRVHELVVREGSLSTQLVAIREGIGRLETQLQRLAERQASLLANYNQDDDPRAELQAELEQKLGQRLDIEKALGEVRQQLDDCEAQIRDVEKDRARLENEIQESRASLEGFRIAVQELQTRRNTIAEQVEEIHYKLADLLEEMPDGAGQDGWQNRLTQVENRIQRLGAINLAAMDEYKVESERKSYLDAQNDELADALETLESAIRKIDRETRTKFKETYDAVNTSLQALFPKLFGGGHAYLELTGEDLLDAGVTIMAQPPGKKNTTVHLLSGGEKALTAIALVFSIFRLNPAPFCMLDEVDAPLDDANVGRYANLVKEMSETVQFIYITHNKQSMEMASQLMGVTMNEPGVSRLVSVDVDEAAELAE